MRSKSDYIKIELYAARFRREFNGLRRALVKPNATLQAVFVKSRRTGKAVVVLISATAYSDTIADIKIQKTPMETQTY